MSKVNIPKSGDEILQWARNITREVNSLQPSNDEGDINVKKTDNGTSYSIKDKLLHLPDSKPRILNTIEDPEDNYGTTYSIELNEQNSFSLFGFGSITSSYTENAEYYEPSALLSGVDFILRDYRTENGKAILSSPTLVYQNVVGLLSTAIIGSVSTNLSEVLSNPTPILSDLITLLSSKVDSESLSDTLVSKSIYHNSNGEIAIYNFETVTSADILSAFEDGDYLLARTEVSGIPTLKYANGFMSDSELKDDKLVSKSIYKNSEGGFALYDFEELKSSDKLSAMTSSDYILVRTENNGIPTLKYIQNVGGGNPDSESLSDTLVSKSIYKNSNGELAIYNFEDVQPSEIVSSFNEGDSILIRTDLSGIPTLKYASGITLSTDCVLSTEYSIDTHKLIEHYRTLSFENGLLVDASEIKDRDVFEAVAEQV